MPYVVGMATLDGYLYVVGGYDGQSRIDTVERYSPVYNKWTFVSNMTMPLSRCQATSCKGYLYVSGTVLCFVMPELLPRISKKFGYTKHLAARVRQESSMDF